MPDSCRSPWPTPTPAITPAPKLHEILTTNLGLPLRLSPLFLRLPWLWLGSLVCVVRLSSQVFVAETKCAMLVVSDQLLLSAFDSLSARIHMYNTIQINMRIRLERERERPVRVCPCLLGCVCVLVWWMCLRAQAGCFAFHYTGRPLCHGGGWSGFRCSELACVVDVEHNSARMILPPTILASTRTQVGS